MASAETNKSDNSGHIQVKLFTKQQQYAVADAPLTIATNVANKELNELVNALLQESKVSHHKPISFDFLVSEEILRTTLQEHLETKELSSEQLIEIEYIERLPTPTPQDCLLHDDWVAAVHASNGFILSGCYDSSAHIWSDKGTHKLKVPAGKGPIKAVTWISQTDEEATFLVGGQEQVVMQWRWTLKNDTADCLAMFKGHERSIESIAVNNDQSMFASGAWDGLLKLWSLNDAEVREDVSKRQRKDSGGVCQTKTPTMTLKGHRDCLSCVRWTGDSEILTCSWDHTLRLWDIEEGGMKQEMTGNKAFLSCDRNTSTGLILASSADKYIRLFDARSTEGSVVKQTYSSHTLWVHAVRWSQTNENLFISAAQDELVKLWDTRSPRAPLYDLGGHTDKVFCCDWSMPGIIVSGGADNTLRIYKAPMVAV